MREQARDKEGAERVEKAAERANEEAVKQREFERVEAEKQRKFELEKERTAMAKAENEQVKAEMEIDALRL